MNNSKPTSRRPQSTELKTRGRQRKARAGLKPIWLPANIVDRLTETAVAADLDGGVTTLVTYMLEGMVEQFGSGDFDIILNGYEFPDPEDREDAEDRLNALVACWKAEDGAD